MNNRMRFNFLTIIILLLISCSNNPKIDPKTNAVHDIIEHWFPEHKDNFVLEYKEAGKEEEEYFELSSFDNKIIIKSNQIVSLASGLNWYLKEYCKINFSINDTELTLPKTLPKIEGTIRKETPFKRRNFFNYCTFGYTMPWWNWDRWSKMIDWMAMNGINMPLAITGQEAVWQRLLTEQGLSDEEIKQFIVGPAYLPWGWMGNIDGLTGPMPDNWIESHKKLQQNILKKQRALGMTPILQGFTGHIPEALITKNPNLKHIKTTDWAGMPGTFFLDPTDPLFKKLGKRFIEIQTELYGTDHLYDADCFNEINPPSKDTTFIHEVGKTVFEGMLAADPEATWVMQGWFLFWQKDFWKEPQARALLDAVPNDKLLLLDLYGEKYPVWNETKAFYGKPWIWNVICNNGQKVNLSGDLNLMHDNFRDAMTNDSAGNLQGIGVMMEGFGYNPIVQDYISHVCYDSELQSIEQWVNDFAARRYNKDNESIKKVWKNLLNSVYNRTELGENVICKPPGRKPDLKTAKYGVNYDVENLISAAEELLKLSEELIENKHYQFDLVHIHREILSVSANIIIDRAYKALDESDMLGFEASQEAFLSLLKDLDQLLATNELFLLGKWIEDAESWGRGPKEKEYYASNAKSILTLWQPSTNTHLRDYASRQWNGLVGDFYMHRWIRFFEEGKRAIQKGEILDYEKLNQELIKWELNWISKDQKYASSPTGNPVFLCQQIQSNYLPLLKNYDQ